MPNNAENAHTSRDQAQGAVEEEEYSLRAVILTIRIYLSHFSLA